MEPGEYRITLKDFPEELQPRERMSRFGALSMSDHELLALLLSTGTREKNALELAQSLLGEFGGLKGIAEASLTELSAIHGVGIGKGSRIIAAMEMGRRLSTQKADFRATIKSPEDVSRLVMQEMRCLDRESFRTVLLNTKNQVIALETVSIGDLSSALVHPREVFKGAIKKSAKSIILVHNHPSGDPTPSKEDINITGRLIESGRILQIDILDHLIIGDNKYVSLKEAGHI